MGEHSNSVIPHKHCLVNIMGKIGKSRFLRVVFLKSPSRRKKKVFSCFSRTSNHYCIMDFFKFFLPNLFCRARGWQVVQRIAQSKSGNASSLETRRGYQHRLPKKILFTIIFPTTFFWSSVIFNIIFKMHRNIF